MKNLKKKKEKIAAFGVFDFTHRAIKGLHSICYRRIEMKPTEEHKTTLHVLIIHGMNQKFNHLPGLISIIVLPNIKKIATKIHKEAQRKKVVFYILLRITSWLNKKEEL